MEYESTSEQRSDPDLLPPKLIDGKDELNLAEFPLSAITDRLNADQKTLTFEDRIWDNSRCEMVTRQLTVTASDEHGLPTAHDDEVILGLIQLSKLRNFSDRRVNFTRYELLRILSWGDEGKSYERLEKSLNRWVGVTLYYKNAWWSKEQQCWVDESFHIIENVRLYDKEKAEHQANQQSQFPLSSFTWNDVIFRSFQAGNLKSIDFDFLKSLDSAVAKRLYRFLDKRFYHRSLWEFDLKEVSWEHIGLSRKYDSANLKRKLLPGIRELERRGFLRPASDQERFKKVRSGQWRVVFEKARPGSKPRDKSSMNGTSPLIQALVQRGVSASTAEQTVSSYPAERIEAQMEVFDWLISNRDPKVSRNPAGFLISSIKSEYTPPKGFVSREERDRRQAQAAERKRRQEERARALAAKEEARRQAREEAVHRFWRSLSEEERIRAEEEAISQANSLERDVLERGGAFAASTRKSLLDTYALRVLQHAA